MTVRLSKAKMDKIAKACDDIEEGVKGNGDKIGGLATPDLDGWQFKGAVTAVNDHWQKKTEFAASQWRYMASGVRNTTKAIVGTDEAVAFTFPPVGKGESDIPIDGIVKALDPANNPTGVPPLLRRNGN